MQPRTRWTKWLAVIALVGAGACSEQSPTSLVDPRVGEPSFSTSSATVARVVLLPGSQTLSLGQNRSLIAIAYNSRGSILSLSGRSVTWKSSNPTAVKVTSTGVAKTLAGGKATITATVDGVSGVSILTVDAPLPPASIKMSAAQSVAVGESAQLSATVVDEKGTPMTGYAVTWKSSNPAVATVSSTGVVKALSAGSATIIASAAGLTGKTAITAKATAESDPVSPTGIAQVILYPGTQTIEVGQVRSMIVMLKDSKGNIMPLNGRTITWKSSNSAVASRISGFNVRGWSAGFATISATVEGVTGSSTFVVVKAN